MKYDETMATKDKEKWVIYVEEEYNKIKTYNVWAPIKLKGVPDEANMLTSTWDMKKKSSWVHIARLNDHGYEKVYGVHYDSAIVASQVTNDVRIKTVLVLAIISAWTTKITDVKG